MFFLNYNSAVLGRSLAKSLILSLMLKRRLLSTYKLLIQFKF